MTELTAGRLEPTRSATWWLAVLIAVQTAVWALVPALLHTSPPLDVVESYIVGAGHVIGNYKHPALPGWLLEASRQLTGQIGWPSFVLSQACVIVTLASVYALGRDIFRRETAVAGTMLLSGVAYFSWLTVEFNHNVAQLTVWAMLVLVFWRALKTNALIFWFLVGAVGALSLYAKLSSAVILGTLGLWLLVSAPARARLLAPGPWLALAVFGLGVVPLVQWLMLQEPSPFAYAGERMKSASVLALPFFLVKQMAAMLGAVVIALTSGVIAVNSPFPESGAEAAPSVDPVGVRYVLFVTVVPIAVVGLAALVSGTGLRGNWAMAMLSFTGLLAAHFLHDRLRPERLPRLAVHAMVIVSLAAVVYGAVLVTKGRMTKRPHRGEWPQAVLASRFRSLWQTETGRPLAAIGGEDWIGSLIALDGRGPLPAVLNDNRYDLSLGITAETVRRTGILVVWEEGRGTFAGSVLPDWPKPAKTGQLTFDWPYFGRQSPLRVNYAIILPER